MKKIFTVLVVGLIGCTSSVDEPTPTQTFQKNDCVTAGAQYEFDYYQTSGDCGPIDNQVVAIPEDGVLTTKGCTSGPNSKYEGCSVYLDQTCSGDVNGVSFTIKELGKVDWAEDGSSGSGTMQLDGSASDGSSCHSTYRVTAKRL